MSPTTDSAVHSPRKTAVGSTQTEPESRPRVPLARPACTHTTMDTIHGTYTCQICQQSSPLGFVYFCQQDVVHGPITQLPPSLPTSRTHRRRIYKNVPSGGPSEQNLSLSAQLDILGFSKDIVQAAENGHYTPEQIQIMKNQKLNVKKTIQKSLEAREILRSKSGPSPSILSDKLAALSIYKQSSQPSKPSSDGPDQGQRRMAGSVDKAAKMKLKKDKPESPLPPPTHSVARAFESCEYRVCHNCRPLFRDRCFASFESAWAGSARIPTIWIPQLMPVAPASTMKTIGLKEPHGPTSQFTEVKEKVSSAFDQDSDESDIEPDFIPNSRNPRISVVEDLMRDTKRNSASEDRQSLMQIQKYASHSSLSLSQQDESSSETGIENLYAADTQQADTKQADAKLGDTKQTDKISTSVKPQSSSVGFHASLSKDMRAIIERGNREIRQSSSRHANPNANAQPLDTLTGLDGHILERLNSLYRKNRHEVFDLALWKALSDSILEVASRTPLPGKDGGDGLDQDAPRVNGIGVMIDGRDALHEDEEHVVGLALTEEAAENHSPDIITSI